MISSEGLDIIFERFSPCGLDIVAVGDHYRITKIVCTIHYPITKRSSGIVDHMYPTEH